MLDDRAAHRVGAATIGLLAVAAAAVVLAGRVELRPGIEVEVYFEHLGGLRAGADVQTGGAVIGRIKDVRLVPARAASAPDHPLAGEGGVAVVVRVSRRRAARVPVNGEFFVSQKGIIGEAFLEVGPPPPEVDLGRAIQRGDRVRGIDPPRMDRVLMRSFENLTVSRLFLETIRPEARELFAAARELAATLRAIEPEPGAFADLGQDLDELVAEARAVSALLEAGEIDPERLGALARRGADFFGRARAEVARLRARSDRLASEVERIRDSLPADLAPRLALALARARVSLARLEATAAAAEDLMDRVSRGHGTVGALLHDPEFIDDAKQLGKILKRQPWRIIGRPPE